MSEFSNTTPRVAIVLAGGDPVDPATLPPLPEPDLVVAADSGLHAAATLGLAVDILVGDLDSVSIADEEAARRAGTTVQQHPVDKDATDLELALIAAVGLGVDHIIVVGGGGGRLDHLLGNTLLLTDERWSEIEMEWWPGATRIVVVRRSTELRGSRGDMVGLLAVCGPAEGITTTGLRWRLSGERLDAGSTRGVSNQLDAESGTVSIAAGTLLVIHERSPS